MEKQKQSEIKVMGEEVELDEKTKIEFKPNPDVLIKQ